MPSATMLHSSSIALDRCRLFDAASVPEIEQGIAQVMQPHRLAPIGSSERHGRMDYLAFPAMGIGSIAFGPMALEVEQDDFFLLIMCRRGQARIALGKQEIEVTGSTGVCLSPGDIVRASFSEDCEQLVFRLDGPMVRRFAGGDARLRERVDLLEPALAPWLQLVRMLISDAPTIDLVSKNPAVAASYQDVFLSTLFASDIAIDRTDARGAVPACVRRAEQFIFENFRLPLTLETIAAASRVAPRTLLQSFRSFCGTSPIRLLRDVRLDAARDMLLSADRGSPTILSVAYDVGFMHAARFSQQYYRRFGEKPSETIRK